MLTELTSDQFANTMIGKMTNVTRTAKPVINIWPYVEKLTEQNVVNSYILKNKLVEVVYRNEDETFDHILLPTANPDEFVVLIVDLKQRSFYGYYRLNVQEEEEVAG